MDNVPMTGQGSPKTLLAQYKQFVSGLLLWCCCALANASDAGTINLRLQIAWGGNTARLWRGTISVANGKLSDIRLLGVDADQPGSFVDDGSRILISPRFPHKYSGLEVSVSAPADADLRITLTPDLDSSLGEALTIPLTELISDVREQPIGENHLLRVARVAGDAIRIRLNRDSLVFEPGERIRMDMLTNKLDVKPGSLLRAKFRLRSSEERRSEIPDFWNQVDDDLWSRSETLKVDASGSTNPITNIEFPIPEMEGVYELTVDLTHRLPQVGTVGKRTIQFVVINSNRPPLAGFGSSTLVTEFNPAADPNWFDRMTQLPQWKILPRQSGPWSNQPPAILESQGKPWTQLTEGGWIAYSLPVSKPGIPHILDVQFPAGFAQDVGISILEPDAAGQLSLSGLNSGVTIGDPDLLLPGVSAPPIATTHRLVFWPKTSSPVVMLSNRKKNGTVAFGRIRLESFKQGLPTSKPSGRSNRKRIAQIDGDLLKQIFFARHVLDERSQVGVDDWQTFYEAGSRLIHYLRYAGYDGVALLVAGQGSSLYPSEYLHPTPLFDRGIFAGGGQDPYRKDVIEMLLRMFDREGLIFIPAIEFATPLPALEKQLSAGATSEGIELVDVIGRLGADIQRESRGQAPYYNPLDPRVQTAMLDVVKEIVMRYAEHESFAGVDLRMLDVGYAHLPDVGWAFDRAQQGTLSVFGREHELTRSLSPDELTAQLREQIERNQPTPLLKQWLDWRTNRLADFYHRMATTVQSRDADDFLYLSLAGLTSSAPCQRNLRPTLPRKTDIEAAMRELGLDVRALSAEPGVVVLRPQRIAPMSQLGAQAVNLELLEPDVQNLFDGEDSPAAQFLHEPQQIELESLETPFVQPTSGVQAYFGFADFGARRPFARSLAANDTRLIFDGGRAVPMGQEAALQRFFAVYRHLPNQPFELAQRDATSPLVVRTASNQVESFAYVVNVSPWPVKAELHWEESKACTVEFLGATTSESTKDQTELEISLEPYGLVAVKFSVPNLKQVGCRAVALPEGIARQLSVQLDEVVSRADQIQQERQPTNILRDAGFESAVGEDPNAAWTMTAGAAGSVKPDNEIRAEGNTSLRLIAENGPVSIISHVFAAPETGRLVISMKLRTSKPTRAPLKLSLLTSDPNYQPRYFFEQQLTTDFVEIPLRFPPLPADPNLQMQLIFEMVDRGEVWIDDVRLYDKWLVKDEPTALMKILYLADRQQRTRDLATCYDTLSGYWPRFLLRHVPPTEIAALPAAAVQPTISPAPQKSRLLDRWKKLTPPWFR